MMTRWFLSLGLAAGLCLTADLSAHGGTYRGPGDTVPPSAGGAAAPTAPAPPAAPSPASPATPTTPTTPSTPSTPNVPTVPTAAQPQRAVTGPANAGPDLTTWEFWWEFNKEPYLNLKSRIHEGAATTGESDLLLGLGTVTSKNNTYAPSIQQIKGTILPALKRSLERDESVDILSSDLIALAKIGRDEQTPSLIKPFFLDNNQEIAETAALAYGILQYTEALQELKDLALDTPAGRKLVGKETGVPLRSRTFAVYGLGLVGHTAADQLIKKDIAAVLWDLLLKDESALKDIRVACVVAIGLLGLEDSSETVANLASYLASDQNDYLVRSHCPNAMAKLLRASQVPNAGAKAAAVQQFLALLANKDSQAEIRQSCVQALGMLTSANDEFAGKVYDALVELEEKGRDRQEKNFTAISLAYLGATADGPIRAKVTEYLVKQVDKGSTQYRPWAAVGLGVMSFKIAEQSGGSVPDVAGRAVLAKFKDASSPSEKAGYAIALGLMRFEEAKDDIQAAMEKLREENFRGYCAVALGLMGAREHKDYIHKLVQESQRLSDLLRQASIGLGLMNDHQVVDTLLEIMQPADGSSRPVSVLAAVATALGFIGDHRSVTPLVEYLSNDRNTPLSRAFAAVALGIVADKEKLPWNSKISVDLNYRAAVDTLTDPESATGVLDIL